MSNKPTLLMAARQTMVEEAVNAVVATLYKNLEGKATVAEGIGVLEMAKQQLIDDAKDEE